MPVGIVGQADCVKIRAGINERLQRLDDLGGVLRIGEMDGGADLQPVFRGKIPDSAASGCHQNGFIPRIIFACHAEIDLVADLDHVHISAGLQHMGE